MRGRSLLQLFALVAFPLVLTWGCPGDDDDFAGDDDDDDTGDDDSGDDDSGDDDSGNDDDTGDDDSGDDDVGDDDTTPLPYSISGAMVPVAVDPPPIDAGTTLRIRAYSDAEWLTEDDTPIDCSVFTAEQVLSALGTWPMTFHVPLADAGTYYLWALADADDSGDLSPGDSMGRGTDHPIEVQGHETKHWLQFDDHWPDEGDDDVGDDDVGDDDATPPG